ncbi:MAG: hypothetical protein A2X49_15995 [Lentisphaerae bacterium GWF2_52_8]|nr:MAG: hypothetical protein A2X49_15995 [Lentisphaerae bacterium GWF2_52_8]
MKDWKNLLERRRARHAKPNGMQGYAGAKFDMSRFWRGKSYLELVAATPEPIARASAFERVLSEIPKIIHPDSIFCGEQDWLLEVLPISVSGSEEYERVVEADRARRTFWSGYDHTIPDYNELLRIGLGGYFRKLEESRRINTDTQAKIFLDSVEICLRAFSRFIKDYADETARQGMGEMAGVLLKIQESAPSSFREALQLVWLVHVAMFSEGRGANALGRIDQYLLPFYENDLKNGLLSREEALNMVCHLWCMVEGMHEITNICIGGLKPDGSDATNELSYICLEATRLVRSPSTNLSARFHDGSPESYHKACSEVIISGIGFPAIFNDHTVIPSLEKLGIPSEEARDYGLVGCIEPMIPGRQQAWGDSRFNTPRYLLEALKDLPENENISFKDLFARFVIRMREGLQEHTLNVTKHIDSYSPAKFPDPFLSAFTRDCIGRALDINDGGARYRRLHGIAGMGLGTLTDSLSAIKKLVIEDAAISFSGLCNALKSDFEGKESLRLMLLNKAPKYGNADPYADEIAKDIVKAFATECLSLRTSDGGRFVPCMAANIQNISAGKEIGATPDGRRAGTALSDAASPYYGRDMKGPTAFINSVSAPDYSEIACSVVNMRFNPDFFRGQKGIELFSSFTKAFVAKRIQELQFNFNDDSSLAAALADPETHKNLVVRVSGFSAYFVSLDKEVQQDIIRRRAHTLS